MFLSCDQPWEVGTSFLRCNGNILEADNPYENSSSFFYGCSTEYSLTSINKYLKCSAERDTDKYDQLSKDYYIFQLDSYVNNSGYIKSVQNLQSQTVSTVDSTFQEAESTGLTIGQYNQLVESALPVFLVAFTFRFLARFIINKL